MCVCVWRGCVLVHGGYIIVLTQLRHSLSDMDEGRRLNRKDYRTKTGHMKHMKAWQLSSMCIIHCVHHFAINPPNTN